KLGGATQSLLGTSPPFAGRVGMIDLAALPIIVARTLAREGFAVFPVRGKQPLTPRGVYSASRDISRFAWQNADGGGMATGEVSGVDVLDVDIRQSLEGQGNLSSGVGDRDGVATLASLPALPETRTATTPHGGRHYWFRHFVGSRNRAQLAPGLEWFSNGKLVVVPPGPGRAWICQAEIAEAPEWVKAMVRHTGIGHTGTGQQGAAYQRYLDQWWQSKLDVEAEIRALHAAGEIPERGVYSPIARFEREMKEGR